MSIGHYIQQNFVGWCSAECFHLHHKDYPCLGMYDPDARAFRVYKAHGVPARDGIVWPYFMDIRDLVNWLKYSR